jgi:hypothetical protein
MNLVLPVQLDLVLHAHHAIKDIITLQHLVHVYLAVVLDITHHHPLPARHVILHVLLVLVAPQTHVLVVSMDLIIQLI